MDIDRQADPRGTNVVGAKFVAAFKRKFEENWGTIFLVAL